MPYTKSFMMHQGGKSANLLALTSVSDRCELAQPTMRQREG
ncbi:addiction module toxin RelE [Enterobacter cancerogenus]|nr:addiction module toxin RelE [Enterobacter cancerogenus]